MLELATNILIEDNVPSEGILAIHVMYLPANVIIFVIHKNSLKTSGITLRVPFRRDSNKALAPPYTKMR